MSGDWPPRAHVRPGIGRYTAWLLALLRRPRLRHVGSAPLFPGGLSCPALSNVSGFPRIGAQRELKVATESYWSGDRSREDLLKTAAGAARRQLGAPARRRNRPDPVQRLLVLRPGAGHDRAGRRGARALRVGRRERGRPRHLLRDGPRPPGRRRRRHRDGDDEVVRHQLPLHRPRAAARDGVPALLAQAVRQYAGGEGARDRDQAGADRPAHASCCRASAPARSSTGSSCSTRSSRSTPRCSRSSAGSAPSGCRSTSRCWSRTARRGARGARARLQAARRGRGRAQDPRQHLLRPRRRGVPGAGAAAGRRRSALDFVRGEQQPRAHRASTASPRTRRCSPAWCRAATCGSTTSSAASRWCEDLRRHAGDDVVVSTSCSLQHSPIDKRNEPRLDDEVLSWMSFAVQKLDEVATIARGPQRGRGRGRPTRSRPTARRSRTARSRRVRATPQVRERVAAITEADARRQSPFPERRDAQHSSSGCRCSRPRRSARSRRPPRSARRARSCAPARSTRPRTST